MTELYSVLIHDFHPGAYGENAVLMPQFEFSVLRYQSIIMHGFFNHVTIFYIRRLLDIYAEQPITDLTGNLYVLKHLVRYLQEKNFSGFVRFSRYFKIQEG